jgi:hypothetical protein
MTRHRDMHLFARRLTKYVSLAPINNSTERRSLLHISVRRNQRCKFRPSGPNPGRLLRPPDLDPDFPQEHSVNACSVKFYMRDKNAIVTERTETVVSVEAGGRLDVSIMSLSLSMLRFTQRRLLNRLWLRRVSFCSLLFGGDGIPLLFQTGKSAAKPQRVGGPEGGWKNPVEFNRTMESDVKSRLEELATLQRVAALGRANSEAAEVSPAQTFLTERKF